MHSKAVSKIFQHQNLAKAVLQMNQTYGVHSSATVLSTQCSCLQSSGSLRSSGGVSETPRFSPPPQYFALGELLVVRVENPVGLTR